MAKNSDHKKSDHKKSDHKKSDHKKSDPKKSDPKKSASKKTKTKKDTGKPTEEDSRTKHIAIAILFGIGIFFGIYVIYSFIAYTKSWFPFGNYTPPPQPSDAIYPTATNPNYDPTAPYDMPIDRLLAAGFIENDSDRRAVADSNLSAILSNNCFWWCNGRINDDGGVLVPAGDDMARPGNKLKAPNGENMVIQSVKYPGIKRQFVTKPTDDTSNPYSCDCGTYYKDPIDDNGINYD